MVKLTHSLMLGLAAFAVGAAPVSGQTILEAAFTSTGSNEDLNGTQVGLSTNAPGGDWIWGAGWNWSQPRVFATWNGGAILDAAYLGEEDTAIGISFTTNGSYTKPEQFTISSVLYLGPHGGDETVGLGFWSTMPAREDGGLASAFDNFTGLTVFLDESENDGFIQVYSGGSAQGSAISVGMLTESTPYTLSYTVDTTTGDISDVLFQGSEVLGLSSTAFTDGATAFTGVLSGSGSRGYFNDFSVVAAAPIPEPASTAFLAGGLALLAMRRRR